jgi:WW domain-binding protein 4
MKREAEAHSDDDFDRHSKLRKRTVAAGLGEIYDPGLIPIKLKKKEEHIPPAAELKAEVNDNTSPSEENEQSKQIGASRWVKVQWKQPDEQPDGNVLSMNTKHRAEDEVKDEGPSLLSDAPAGSLEHVKTEDPLTPKTDEMSEPVIGAALFKKRKTPACASVSSGRGRRQF